MPYRIKYIWLCK